MKYVFFVSVYTISSRNNAAIFNFSNMFVGKVIIVDDLGHKNLKFKFIQNTQKSRKFVNTQ